MPGSPPTRSSLTALLVCLAAALVVFVGGLGGRAGLGADGSVLSFDPAHPFFPRPWVAPAPDGSRPPINPITSDIDFFVLPGLRRFEQLAPSPARGEWDPGQLLGYPLRANLPYPLNSPLWRALSELPAETRFGFALWLHTALAGWLAWRAARALGAGAAPAWLAAAGTALSFWMTTRWHLPQVACAAVWWGGLVTAVEHVRARRLLLGAAEFGLWGGLALSSGFPQVALLLIGGAGLWSVVRGRGATSSVDSRAAADGRDADADVAPRPAPSAAVAWRDRVLALGGGLLLALAVGAPELGAVATVYDGAARTGEAAQAAALEHGLRPGALLGALLPRFFGHPPDFAAADPPAPRMADWLPARALLSDDIQDNVVEDALFPGTALLLLLPLAWAAGGAARRLLLFALGWVALALVFPWLAEVAPLLRPLGTGSIKRVLVLAAVCLPLAAALGWQALLDGRVRGASRAGWRAAALVGAAIALAASAPLFVDDPQAAAWRAQLWPHALTGLGVLAAAALLLRVGLERAAPRVLFVLLAAVELALLGRAFNPFTSGEERFPSTPGLAALGAAPGRVAVFGDATLLPPSATSLHGVRSVHGVAPLVDARTVELLECVEPGLVDPRDPRVVAPFRDPLSLGHPLLDLLGVTHVVLDDVELALRSGMPVAGEFPDEGFGVLTRPGEPTVARFVSAARVVPDADERLELLRDPGAPWRDAVLLEQPPAVTLPEHGESRPARVLDHAPGMWHVDVDGEGAGLVQIAESWHPGWRALVDGRVVPVLRAQHALMAVAVPEGSRRVSLLFKQPGWPETRHVAWLGLIGVALLGGWGLRRSRAASTR